MKLSNNATIQATSEDIKNSLKNALDYCQSAGLTPEECQEVLNAVDSVYENIIPPPSGGAFGNLLDNIPLIIGGVVVIALLGVLKK